MHCFTPLTRSEPGITQKCVQYRTGTLTTATLTANCEKGVSAYVGDGGNRWCAVHRPDAARLFRLALEKGTAGARYHGVADKGILVRDTAVIVGQHLNRPVVSKPAKEAAAHFGWLGAFPSVDCPASGALTRGWLGWHPSQPSLLADLDQEHYFDRLESGQPRGQSRRVVASSFWTSAPPFFL